MFTMCGSVCGIDIIECSYYKVGVECQNSRRFYETCYNVCITVYNIDDIGFYDNHMGITQSITVHQTESEIEHVNFC